MLSGLATGAPSVLEHGFLTRFERPHRLPTATRQVRSVGTMGLAAYRDAAFDGMDVELDGRQFHDTTEQRDRDLDRDLDAAVAERSTVRLGYGQGLVRPCATAWRLGAMLQASGWAGAPVACGPTCLVRANLGVDSAASSSTYGVPSDQVTALSHFLCQAPSGSGGCSQ